jgi:hypothetical protein
MVKVRVQAGLHVLDSWKVKDNIPSICLLVSSVCTYFICTLFKDVRRIFGPKRDEATGGWRKLHNEELHSLYSSPSSVRVIRARRMRWAGHVVRMGEMRGAYNIMAGKPERRRPLGIPSLRWEDNIKMDLRERGFGDVDWIHLVQDRDRWRALVNTVMNFRVP